MKNLSIRHYLFILIGAVLLGIAAIQLILISVFKQHLNQEVVQKSKQLSTQIIDLAIEQINHDEPNTIFEFQHRPTSTTGQTRPHIEIQQKGNCKVTRHFQSDQSQEAMSIKLECEDNDENGSEQQTQVFKTIISDDEQQLLDADQRLELRQKLHRIIERTHNNHNFDINGFSFITDSEIEQHQARKNAEKNNAVDTLTSYMIYLVIASSIVALIIALWLSHRFTQPLITLSKGFQQLEQGNFGVQIEEKGIGEYQKTLNSFNQMSEHLAELSASEKALQQQGHLAELGEVSRGLAHALRNPMHTIGLSVEQLKDPSLPEKTKAKMHAKIQAKIQHIDKTIKALLTLTAGEITRSDAVPIKAVLQDIILEMKANSSDVNIELNCQDNPVITGSESEIRAILHTIVVNAVEANDNKNTVIINVSEQQHQAIIAVKDQGQGIAPNIKDKLFEPHVSSKAEGAGMGLYISKRLATLYYGGDLTLENYQSSQNNQSQNNQDQNGCIATATLQSSQGEQHE